LICPVIKRIEEKNKTSLPRIYPGDCKPAVKVGMTVSEADVIAHCEVSAGRRLIKISQLLETSGKDVKKYLTKKEGDRIYEGEIIAKKESFVGIKKTEVKSPVDGKIIELDDRGDLVVKFMPKPVRLVAAASGTVANIDDDKIIISTIATKIRGFVSLGKGRDGTITVIAGQKEFILPTKINSDHRGKILVGGALLERATIEKAVTLGVTGIITGGINERDFQALGAGNESLINLLITEGFGNLPMGSDILEFLKKKEGMPAFISAEENSLVIPERTTSKSTDGVVSSPWRNLKVGDAVRYFLIERGEQFGEVKELLGEQIINSGILAEVARVKFLNGEELLLPAVNLEITG